MNVLGVVKVKQLNKIEKERRKEGRNKGAKQCIIPL